MEMVPVKAFLGKLSFTPFVCTDKHKAEHKYTKPQRAEQITSRKMKNIVAKCNNQNAHCIRGFCARALFPIKLVSAMPCVSHSEFVLHTQGCAYPIWLASRPWNAEVHIFPIQQGKTAFQSQSARNVALFLFLTELPGTYYGAVRDVYLAMATRAS